MLFLVVILSSVGCERGHEVIQPAQVPNRLVVQPSEEDRSEPEAAEPQVARERVLDLQVVPEAEIGSGAATDRALPLEVTSSEAEIQIHTKLHLRDPLSTDLHLGRNLFFTWPDQFHGKKILSARYTHRVRGALRGTLVGGNTLNVRPDRGAHRMLLPVSEVFENLPNYPESSANGEHDHLLELELTLQGGELAQVTIQFQAIGPLPHPAVSPLPLPELGARAKAVEAAGGGLALTRESVENPIDRPVRVWLKASVTTLSLWQIVREPVYQLVPEQGPERVRNIPRGSLGLMQVKVVEVRRASGNLESVHLDALGFGWVDLGPRERIELTWMARRVLDSDSCFIPERTRQSFDWIAEDQNPVIVTLYSAFRNPIPRIPYHREIEIEWTLEAAELEGKWYREIRLSHPFVLREQAMGDAVLDSILPMNSFQNHRVVHSEEQSYTLSSSFESDGRRPENLFNCQGFFP